MEVTSYLAEIVVGFGITLLVIEVLILGFATFLLFFVGLALVSTGLIMLTGIVPETMVTALWMTGLLTVIYCALLWKPLKKLQNKAIPQELNSDFADIEFELTGDVDKWTDDILYPYSGIQWKIRSKTPLAQGEKVKVVDREVGVFWVEKAQ